MEQIADTLTEWQRRAQEAAAKAQPLPPMTWSNEPSPEEQAAWERRWEVNVPARYRAARLDDMSGELAEAKTWDQKRNVLLLGNVGAGKTWAAVALARTVHDDGGMVLFRPAVVLIDELKPGGDDQAFKRAANVDLLVLDDLGAERQTDWSADRISAVLVCRYDECLPTIVTSNLDPATLERTVGARIYSRLYGAALRLKVAGEDRRRTA